MKKKNHLARYGTKDADSGSSNELTEGQVQDLVKHAVDTAIGEHLKAVPNRDDIGAAVKAAFDAQRKADIEAAAAKAKADEDAAKSATTEDEFKAKAEAAVKAALDEARNQRKALFGDEGASRGQIDIPYGYSKGNLTPHAKQLLNALMQRPLNDGIDKKDLEKAVALGDQMMSRLSSHGTKALTSTGAHTGDELVPTDLSAQIQRRMYLESTLYGILMANEIAMPSNPYVIPLQTTRPTFYLESTENTDATATDPGTDKTTLTASKLMAEVDASYEIEEDAIIPLLPWITQMLGETAAATWESVLINGDTTATHMDYDTNLVAKAAERHSKGFRRLSLGVSGLNSDMSSGGLTSANLRTLISLMGKYGMKPADLILICGPKGYNTMLGLSEVLTVDKMGALATIHSGVLAALYGIPIVVSAACREDLNASGVDDNATATKGSVLVVNKKGFVLGRRRDLMIETDRVITSQTHKIVASFRRAFSPWETPSATIQTVVIGYNYDA